MKKEKEIVLSDILPEFKNLSEFWEFFPTEQSCIDYLEEHLWKGKPVSPFDPTSQVYKCKKRKNWYKCRNTNKYFNVRTGTKELKYSKIPLRQWFYTFYVVATRKKGVTSQLLGDDIGVTQTSAWNLLKDARSILKQSNFIKSKLKGEWEGDEVFLGGSNTNRHWDKKVPRCQGRKWEDKIGVFVMEQRGGNSIAKQVPNVERKTLFPIIRANAEKGSSAYTDEYPVYKGLIIK